MAPVRGAPSAAADRSLVFARVVRALLILAGASPWLFLVLPAVPLGAHVARGLEAWFALQCHRDSARSLVLSIGQLPVCARCLGIYSGLALGASFLRPRLTPVGVRLVVGFAALCMLLDVLTEWLAMRPESAALRFGTGVLLAWPISVQLIVAAANFGRSRAGSEPVHEAERRL